MLNCKSHATAPPCDAAHKPVMPFTSASALAFRHLALYQRELNQFRREFSSRSLPPIEWFMFGMGRRQKFVYARLRRTTFTGPFITGQTDFLEHPVYQTAWLKFGSTALGISDDWGLPAISDSYKDIFWMPLSNQPEKPTSNQTTRPTSRCNHSQWFPYLTWACDHTHRTKHGPISDQDWPLTFEVFGSRANHENVGRRVDQRYAFSKIVAPHSWHAAEVFLYLHALR